jgi:hypothetical protein
VANPLIFQNVVDQPRVLQEVMVEGSPVTRKGVAARSPYMTDLEVTPQPRERALSL